MNFNKNVYILNNKSIITEKTNEFQTYKCCNCKRTFSITNIAHEKSGLKISDIFASTQQLPFLTDKENAIVICNENSSPDHLVECPYCNRTTEYTSSDNALKCAVFNDNHSTIIKMVDIYTDNLNLPRIMYSVAPVYPVSKMLIFNHTLRQVILCLKDSNDTILYEKDITNEDDKSIGCSLDKLMKDDYQLMEAICNAFEKSGCHINIPQDSISLHMLSLINKFSGFPLSFYNELPFTKERNIDESFSEITEKLTCYSDVKKLFHEYKLPDKPQFCKRIFENPQLIFYAKEISLLPFENYDFLLKIIKDKNIYHFLAYLHLYPGILDFISMVNRQKGEKAGCDFILECASYPPDILNISASYLLLDEDTRNEELRSFCVHKLGYKKPQFKLTLSTDDEMTIPDIKIGEYEFVRLKTNFDYFKAGQMMENCLGKNYLFYPNTYVIKKDTKYCAAIYLKNNEIFECRLAENKHILKDINITEVIITWMKKFNLSFRENFIH